MSSPRPLLLTVATQFVAVAFLLLASLITLAGETTTFTYDANGNMLSGWGGKAMTYDGENRPLSVTFDGKKTCYVYGADGKRLKKIESLAPTFDCIPVPPATEPVVLPANPRSSSTSARSRSGTGSSAPSRCSPVRSRR